MKKKKKKIVPRLGPPTNLRPGGPHKDKTKELRSRVKEQIEKEDYGDEPTIL